MRMHRPERAFSSHFPILFHSSYRGGRQGDRASTVGSAAGGEWRATGRRTDPRPSTVGAAGGEWRRFGRGGRLGRFAAVWAGQRLRRFGMGERHTRHNVRHTPPGTRFPARGPVRFVRTLNGPTPQRPGIPFSRPRRPAHGTSTPQHRGPHPLTGTGTRHPAPQRLSSAYHSAKEVAVSWSRRAWSSTPAGSRRAMRAAKSASMFSHVGW